MRDRIHYPGFWHALLLCGIVIVFQFVVSIPFLLLDIFAQYKTIENPWTMAGINVVSFWGGIWFGLRLGRVRIAEALPWNSVSLRLVPVLALGCAGAFILLSEVDNLFRLILPQPDWIAEILNRLFSDTHHQFAVLVLLVVVAPLTEEPLFRGLILHGFLGRFSPARAIGLSALLFALLHLNPWQFLSALGGGLLMGWWFVRTRSLIPCILGHAFFNGAAYATTYLPFQISGLNTGASGPVQFQPLWLDGLGLALTATGIWLFHNFTRHSES